MTPHRRLLVRLARCSQHHRLPMPQAIYPAERLWSVRVGTLDQVLAYGRALGWEPLMVRALDPVMRRPGWEVEGDVSGIRVQVWAYHPGNRTPGLSCGQA